MVTVKHVGLAIALILSLLTFMRLLRWSGSIGVRGSGAAELDDSDPLTVVRQQLAACQQEQADDAGALSEAVASLRDAGTQLANELVDAERRLKELQSSVASGKGGGGGALAASSQQSQAVPVAGISRNKPRDLVVNVAPSGFARQSSFDNPYECQPDRANDGFVLSFYDERCAETAISSIEYRPWWSVQLLREHVVDSVEIWFPHARCHEYNYPMRDCYELYDIQSTVVNIQLHNDAGEIVFNRDWWHPEEHLSLRTQRGFIMATDRVVASLVNVTFRNGGTADTVMALSEVKVNAAINSADVPCNEWCRNGVCSDEHTCKCSPDYAGEDCATNMLYEWNYLPPEFQTHSGTAGMTWWNNQDSALAQQYIEDKQNPPAGCSEQTAMWCRVIYQNGLGSFLHMMAGYMNHAHVRNKAMVVNFPAWPHQGSGTANAHADWNYAENTECGAVRNTSCYFQPWSPCPVPRPDDHSTAKCCLCRDHVESTFDGDTTDFETPAPFRQHGKIWWRVHQMAYLARLNERFAAHVDAEGAMRRMGFVNDADGSIVPTIGVHIRHTDACHTTLREGRCHTFEEYMQKIRLLRDRYGISRVFLATDSDAMIEASKEQRWADEGFVFVHQDWKRTMLEGTSMIEGRIASGEVKTYEAMRSVLVDLHLLARCRALVVSMSSNLSRLAVELAIGFHHSVVPFISMDSPYVPHWRMACAAKRDGTQQLC